MKRRRYSSTRTFLLAALVVLASGSSAFGQVAPIGVEVGSVRMHPGVFLETAYDSNLYYEDPSEILDGSLTSVVVLKPALGLRILTPAPRLADWTLNLRATWEQYLSEAVAVSNSSGAEVHFDTAATLMPQSAFRLTPRLAYLRTNGPADEYGWRNYSQHTIQPGVAAEIAPRGGVIFSESLSYDAEVRLFDELSDVNRQKHRFLSTTRWNFLPQTSLSLLLEQHVSSYFTEVRTPINEQSTAPTLINAGSMPFRASLALSGLLLNRVDVTLQGGYAYTFYDQGANAHLFLAQAAIGYRWKTGTKLSVGYTKDFSDSTFGNYFTFHRGFVRFQTVVADRVSGSLTGRGSLMSYAPVEGYADRADFMYDVDAMIAYTFVPGLRAQLSYLMRGDATDFAPVVDGHVTSGTYLKHQLQAMVGYEF